MKTSLLRQDKRRGVTILDHKIYIEECLDVFNTKQFHKLQKDPTKTLDG